MVWTNWTGDVVLGGPALQVNFVLVILEVAAGDKRLAAGVAHENAGFFGGPAAGATLMGGQVVAVPFPGVGERGGAEQASLVGVVGVVELAFVVVDVAGVVGAPADVANYVAVEMRGGGFGATGTVPGRGAATLLFGPGGGFGG